MILKTAVVLLLYIIIFYMYIAYLYTIENNYMYNYI